MALMNRTMQQGLAVGLIAYAAVALFYGAFDLLAARGTLFTVDLLGKAVFRGLRDPSVLQYPIAPDMMAILWYNGVHLLLSLGIGVVVTRLVGEAEQRPARAPLIVLAIVAGFVVTVFVVGQLTAPMRPLLPWWSIVVANGLATLTAGAYLMHERPGLWRRLMPIGGPSR